MGKQGHAPCKTSSSMNTHGSHLLWASTIPKEEFLIMESSNITGPMAGGQLGTLWWGLGCGIKVDRVEMDEMFATN